MATILLQAAGAAVGGIFGPVGAVLGRAAGALAGSAIDRSFTARGHEVAGPRLAGARLPASDEGAGLARVYGTVRVAGTMIWATRFEEEVMRERSGGKGRGGETEVTRYSYYGNFAIALCEGPIAGVRRVWADGREIDLTTVEMRVHRGTGDQMPDPLIEAKQGAGMAPAYRGTAYVVFERLPLDGFGNRIPLINCEVVRPVGRLESELKAITIIPGATEHGYDPRPVSERVAAGEARVMNRNVLHAESDWTASIDELQALCPKLERVALVCAWFGDDLRAGECTIAPRVEVSRRDRESRPWRVAGLSRDEARLVGRHDGGPAYGGTPSDASVLAAIADLKARGLKVFLYPFVMMDVGPGNGLPDPWGGAEQATYPWRGRITCHPAPGMAGSSDGTAEAGAEIASFCGRTDGYRRFVLHYAQLAAQAGGIDGIVIGSELRGLTSVRDGSGEFPFVGELVSLAEAVRAEVGPETAITYGADWSEYFGYRPADGSGDHFFNLDPLWASEAITAVGIDNYMPLADWRDGDLTEGNPDGFETPTDADAMLGQIAAGEGFDWYYASHADRVARKRTAITDGAAGKPWVFRYKDLEGWWANRHYERRGGTEVAAPTAWRPRMKPIWFTELGCPAVDKGANQPNVFPDEKSAEGGLPYFSSGGRSDLMQRRFLEAHLEHWTSDVAPAGMVDPDHIFAWTWDARPYPAFPAKRTVWSDGGNWRTGHWLNGRLGSVGAADLTRAVLADHGFDAAVVGDMGGDFSGYVQTDPASARAVIEPILDLVQADAAERGGRLVLRSRTRRAAEIVAIDRVVDADEAPLIEIAREPEGDLAREAVLEHFDAGNDYERAAVRSRRVERAGERQERLALPLAIGEEAALAEIDLWLRERWAGRESARFALPATMAGIDVGDVVRLAEGDGAGTPWMVTRIEDGISRRIEARAWVAANAAVRTPLPSPVNARGSVGAGWAPVVHILDLPVIEGADETIWARAAAFSRPWRQAALYSSADGESYERRVALTAPGRVGVLAEPLEPGRSGRFDRRRALTCDIFFGALSSASEIEVLNGANVLAVMSAAGVWEVLQFARAEEIAAGRWRLTDLLRGQAGTEDAALTGAAEGATVVVLDRAVVPIGMRGAEQAVPLDWQVRREGEAREVAEGTAAGLRALTPLSPVHLKAKRGGDGTIRFSWIRRGRFDADSWLPADIPLDVTRERYRVEIAADGTLGRTLEVEEPAYAYGEADQVADFGARAETVTVTVRQFGERVALGLPATATFSF